MSEFPPPQTTADGSDSLPDGGSSFADLFRALSQLESVCCDHVVRSSDWPAEGSPDDGFLAAEDGPGAVAIGTGISLCGQRCAALLGEGLDEALPQLRRASRRNAPLVVQAASGWRCLEGADHSGCHLAAESGAFAILPHNSQQALDYSLLAHWLSERALVPGLLMHDRRGIERIEFPSQGSIRGLLGGPRTPIEAPTAAQSSLFGEYRPTLVPLLDPDRPAAWPVLRGSAEGASAEVGREVFFRQPVESLAAAGMREVAALTGRPLDFIAQDQVQGADQVVVVQGGAFYAAVDVARRLRALHRWKVGVLGVTWLRPFPSQALRQALRHAPRILVLERVPPSFGTEGPLTMRLRGVLEAGGRGGWGTVRYGLHGQALHAGELARSIEMQRKDHLAAPPHLGIASSSSGSAFPKRDSLLEATRNDYPLLDELGLSPAAPLDSQGGPRLLLLAPAAILTAETAEILARSASKGAGAAASSLRETEPGLMSLRLDVGLTVPAAEAGASLDAMVVDPQASTLARVNPFADLKPKATLAIRSAAGIEETWALLPSCWAREVRRLDLRAYLISPDSDALVKAVQWLSGDQGAKPTETCDWCSEADLSALPPSDSDGDAVPLAARRIAPAESDFASLPRFWGEVCQPILHESYDGVPEPLNTLGAVPGSSSALAPQKDGAAGRIPRLDAEKCSGCGLCWTLCPDSAIGAAVLSVREWLDHLAQQCLEPALAGKARRTNGKVAAQLAAGLKEGGTLDSSLVREAYEENGFLNEEPDRDSRIEDLVRAAFQVAPIAAETFFRAPESKRSGTGGLLFLAIDPAVCQGCRACIEACPESALLDTEGSAVQRHGMTRSRRSLEALPDTRGKVIAQSIEEGQIGTAASILLSRHCSQAQLGGGNSEAGSGERLAARLIFGAAEYVLQQGVRSQTDKIAELTEGVRSRRQSLLGGIGAADADAIESALANIADSQLHLADLENQLAKRGKGVRVDRTLLADLTRIERELHDESEALLRGPTGLGRARYSIVAAGKPAQWAACYPWHPYHAPLSADGQDAIELAVGMASAAVAQCLKRVRLRRRAAMLAEGSPDLPERLRTLESLKWNDLQPDERRICPPLFLLVDAQIVHRRGAGGWSKALSSDLPIKVVLLDSQADDTAHAEPGMLALAHPETFVLSASPAHAEHLIAGLEKALEWPGAAWIQICSPSPSRQGFPAWMTLERARLATEARVHPLFVRDPAQPGVWGARLSLAENPAPDRDWGEATPAQWAWGESRFASEFQPLEETDDAVAFEEFVRLSPAQRGDRVPFLERDGQRMKVGPRLVELAARRLLWWDVYREMAGMTGPFVDRIEAGLREEFDKNRQAEAAEAEAGLARRLQAAQGEFESRMAERLRRRLRSLALGADR